MADQKVTDLAPATTPLGGGEILYVVQGGADRQATAQDIANLGSGGVSDGDKGDITVSSSGSVWTINNNAVTFAKMQSVSGTILVGRHAGGSGAIQEVSVGNGVEFSGSGIRRSALTGDVTASAGSNTLTIANLAVTNAKINDVAWSKVTGTPTTLSGYGITNAQLGVQFQDEGSNLGSLGTATTLNFTGSAVTASRVGDVVTVNVAAGGLTNFTEASNTSAPNATVPVNSLTATGAAANIDAAFRPKGTGALLGNIPDSTSTGGNKRGIYAVDWQTSRTGATEVASGDYSVIAGGFNNRASGTQSFSGGGLQNRANGGQSVVCGGQNNQATNSYTFIGGGLSNQATQVYATAVGGLNTLATGQWSFAGGGSGNTASGTTSVVVGGASNSASGQASWIPGGISASTRSIFGKYAWAANGGSGLIGGRQRGGWTGFVDTSNATTANVTTDGSAISTVNVDTLPDTVNGFTYRFTIYVTASSNSNAKSWEIKGIITRNGGAATTAMVATPVKTVIMESAGATTWDCSVIADTTRGALVTQVTGQAATNIRWFTEHHTHEIWRPA